MDDHIGDEGLGPDVVRRLDGNAQRGTNHRPRASSSFANEGTGRSAEWVAPRAQRCRRQAIHAVECVERLGSRRRSRTDDQRCACRRCSAGARRVCAAPGSDQHTCYMIGDSTMADKPNPETNPERGWGHGLPRFFDDQVVVRNHAVNGRSIPERGEGISPRGRAPGRGGRRRPSCRGWPGRRRSP